MCVSVRMCVRQAGIYWITLIDTFSSNWVLLILALAEVIGFIYMYGTCETFVFMDNRSQNVLYLSSLVSFVTFIASKEMQNGEHVVLSQGFWSTFACFPVASQGGIVL